MDIIQKSKIKETLLSLEEASELINVSKHTIRSWCQKNIINSSKVKGRYGLETRVKKSELLNYTKSIKIEPNKKSVKNEEVKTKEKSKTPEIKNKSILNDDTTNYTQELKKSLNNALEQLKIKDEQIKSLMEKLTQANTLTLNAQTLALNSQEEKRELKEKLNLIESEKPTKKKFLGIF